MGCCCPLNGCWTPPYYNWIIGICKGDGCGGYAGAPDTQSFKNAGSDMIVNYVASYQWDKGSKKWMLDKPSSFNTDGSKQPYDTIKPNGGLSEDDAWMQPQPGGAAAWTWGFYPAGVRGVGPPGMMFVLSVKSAWNIAWYMLNQVNLDKGPAVGYPANNCTYGNSNCWASGNSGEIDFLESVWTVNSGATDNYRRLYSTQWNQIGRSFVGQQGATCNSDGGWFTDTLTTNNYFRGAKRADSTPYVFVAVVDSVGTFIYRIPSGQVGTIWPGLTETTANCTLDSRPAQRPPNSGPPCNDSNSYCALFLPNCQADMWGGASAGRQGGANQGCKVNGQQGWCQNWWRLFDNTGQWLWPENGRPSVINFQRPAAPVTMPWNYEMESWKVDWQGNAQLNPGCCVKNQGFCAKMTDEVNGAEKFRAIFAMLLLPFAVFCISLTTCVGALI